MIPSPRAVAQATDPQIQIIQHLPHLPQTGGGKLTAGAVIQATNVPVAGFTTLHVKDAAYRTYAIAYPSNAAHPEGLFWDTAEPYHYTRWQDTSEGTFMIVGGEDHRVGEEEDTDACFQRLLDYVRAQGRNPKAVFGAAPTEESKTSKVRAAAASVAVATRPWAD